MDGEIPAGGRLRTDSPKVAAHHGWQFRCGHKYDRGQFVLADSFPKLLITLIDTPPCTKIIIYNRFSCTLAIKDMHCNGVMGGSISQQITLQRRISSTHV